ncbi:hypothetical protein H4R34_004634 [Dimargaris verticillata]|uniref:J domain-containing protein n=1 Tax=Dimargaris verticillata TaxID=2761393 RepID=A0A9W8EBH9_9FUNG|nr:hypothetical protein H4R34_004634 [Dimargaris verticillata]
MQLFTFCGRSWLALAFGLLCLTCLLSSPAMAWDEKDYEIFDLVDFLKKAQSGKDTTFYDILGVPSTADLSTINQAFKRKSFDYHPDKNPSKEAGAIFSRLGSIMSILRKPAMRERYDFYMKNGVPVWRGTGYFYRRYRPGLPGVVVGLLLFAALVQYLVQWLNHTLAVRKIRYHKQELAKRGLTPSSSVSAIARMASMPAAASNDKVPLTRRQQKLLEREEKWRQQQARLDAKEQERVQETENEAVPTDPEEARFYHMQRYWASQDPEQVPRPSVSRLFLVQWTNALLAKFSSGSQSDKHGKTVHKADREIIGNADKRAALDDAPVATRTRHVGTPQRSDRRKTK